MKRGLGLPCCGSAPEIPSALPTTRRSRLPLSSVAYVKSRSSGPACRSRHSPPRPPTVRPRSRAPDVRCVPGRRRHPPGSPLVRVRRLHTTLRAAPHWPDAHPVRHRDLRHDPPAPTQDRRPGADQRPPRQHRHGLGLSFAAQVRAGAREAAKDRRLTTTNRTPQAASAAPRRRRWSAGTRAPKFQCQGILTKCATNHAAPRPSARDAHTNREKCGLDVTLQLTPCFRRRSVACRAPRTWGALRAKSGTTSVFCNEAIRLSRPNRAMNQGNPAAGTNCKWSVSGVETRCGPVEPQSGSTIEPAMKRA